MEYKVLTVIEPWATLIINGFKKIETRPQGIFWKNYRGIVLIHASKTFTDFVLKLCGQEPFKSLLKLCGIESWNQFQFGSIIGSIEIVGCIFLDDFKPDEVEFSLGDYSFGRVGLLLRNPVKFNHPIPAKGQQGLWIYRGEINER